MCTGIRFDDDQNNLYFGRNLDIAGDYGEKVIVTPRNYKLPYKFLDDSKTTKALIGMGLVVDNYPLYFDCCSEDGICIAGLNFPHYAKFAEDAKANKTNLAPYELMLWAVENFNSVKDIKQALKDVELVNKSFVPKMGVSPLHWIISDADSAIVVEQSNAGLKVFDNKVGVLTNSPDFEWQLTNLDNYVGLNPKDAIKSDWNGQDVHQLGVGTGSLGLPGDSIPASRFVKAAYLNAFYPTISGEKANVAKLLNILKAVAMVNGSVVNDQGQLEYTVYSSCYSQKTKTYYYNYYNDFELKSQKLTEENSNSAKLTVY